jgi:Tol biopolymer transport system component
VQNRLSTTTNAASRVLGDADRGIPRNCGSETKRSGSLIGDCGAVGPDLNAAGIAAASVHLCFFLLPLLLLSLPLSAQREPVLPQIDLPHPYYYRELYLPQLTSGPSSVAWAPDSKEIVYSMAGSLWRQKLDSKEALQLTDGAGYDYQPDWSPDGKSIIYVSYQKDAIELWLLDVANGKSSQLTSGGAVNVEPRWSPDGKRIIFVSTQFNKRFHIFRADIRDGKLENIVRLTGETKSDLPRYYYSQYDTEINPAWTRDGQEILFISNKGHIHGTGGFWRMKAELGATARKIHYEETNWKTRPDFSPDGSRMVYSSYLGGQWHNLWLMPANGGDAFPISYGDFDHTNARWSPDGAKIAFISNFTGSTAVETIDIPGGSTTQITQFEAKYFHFKSGVGRIELSVLDDKGRPISARVSLLDAAGRFCLQVSAVVHADDGIDRGHRPFERHYVYVHDRDDFLTPQGDATLEISHGLDYLPEKRIIHVAAGETRAVTVRLKPVSVPWPKTERWASGDLHVHMNYGGTYWMDSKSLTVAAAAEHLEVVNNLVVNKEQRFPDIAYSATGLDESSEKDLLIVHGQEFHTSYWGHRGILKLKQSILLPGYAGYPNTAAASLFPMNADVYDMAHAQGALVGAVHPFDEQPDPFATPAQRITDELPVDVALGKLDYMEIVGFSDHQSTAAVWYKLLNLGFHVPAGGGTDATTNYAAPIRGNVGFDRVYVQVPAGPLNFLSWTDALANGKSFATNGPLLYFTLGGKNVGGEIKLDAPREAIPFTARLRSVVPVDHFEVVCNGKLVQGLELDVAHESADIRGTVPLHESGWCVLRAWSDKAQYPVMDHYAYGTTSPIYIDIAGAKPRSPEDAKYFAAWITRTIEITAAYPDWNSAQEKELVLRRLNEAKQIYEKMQ